MTRLARRFVIAVGALASLATLVAGSVAAKPSRAQVTPVTVLAAASLVDVFPSLDKNQIYSFAGSNTLANQIRNGAPADVFASSNPEIPQSLYRDGLVQKPVSFTRNKLVVVVPRSNPAGITNVYDLAKPGVKVDVAAPSVPAGSYTAQILRQMGLTAKIGANIVSQETDVRTLLAKVALGQADAGFVYATDARAAGKDVIVIKVPAWAQPKVIYQIAVVSSSPHRAEAQAFVKRVLSKAGQAKLISFGFLALPKPVKAKSARYELSR
jgi:molybdate transport system substrate-binding protein